MHAPTRAPRPKSSYAWLILPVVALIYGAMATFGRDTGDITAGPETFTVDASARGGPVATFENVIADTIPTCSDSGFPNTRATCFTASELLNRSGSDTNWPLMLLAVAIGVVGFLGFAQMLPWQKKKPTTAAKHATKPGTLSGGQDIRKPPSSYLLAPLLMQDSSAVGSGWAGWQGGVLTFLLVAAAMTLLIGGVLWGRKRDADKKAGRR